MESQKFYIGNYKKESERKKGWFAGWFMDGLRQSKDLEIKYWTFKETKNPSHELKVQRNSTEYTFIITGEIIGRVEGEKINLKTGDYIIIRPGTVNNLVEEVAEDVIGITIKAPSLQNDTVKIRKEYIKSLTIDETNISIFKGFMNSIKDKRRFWGAIIFLLLGILFLVIYFNPFVNFIDRRLFWCLAFSFIGFFFPAFEASLNNHHDDDALISYSLRYFPVLIIIPGLVFTVLQFFEATRNDLFYYSSAFLCLMLSRFIDNIINEGPVGIFKSVARK